MLPNGLSMLHPKLVTGNFETRRHAWLLAVVSAALAAVVFGAAGHDDTHITLWAAQELASSGRLTNYNGELVEQSSSLLHVTLLALLELGTPFNLANANYLLLLACGMAATIRIRELVLSNDLGGSYAALLLATNPLHLHWSVAGLEAPLVILVATELLLAFRACHAQPERRDARARFAACALLLAMARPELPFVLISALLLLAAQAARVRDKPTLRVLGFCLAAAAASFVFLVALRMSVFGEPFPRPVWAKVGHHQDLLERCWSGFVYLAVHLTEVEGLTIAMGALASVWILLSHGELHARLASSLLLSYLCFVIVVGGDWMTASRFLGHVVGLAVFVLVATCTWRSLPAETVAAAVGALVMVQLAGVFQLASREALGRPAWSVIQEWDAVALSLEGDDHYALAELGNKPHLRDTWTIPRLRTAVERIYATKGRPVTILSGQAGMVMFHVAGQMREKVRFLDLRGLTDRAFEDVAEQLAIAHTPLGLEWTYEDFFVIAKDRDEPRFRPDLMFDLHHQDLVTAQQNGYVIIYQQFGWIESKFDFLPDRLRTTSAPPSDVAELRARMEARRADRTPALFSVVADAHQFIAVREDLLETLERPVPDRFHWNVLRSHVLGTN